MMPGPHAAVSLGIGLLGWWWSRSPVTLPAALAAGTLVDVDHIADYAYYALTQEHRLILPLHGYELAIPLWLVTNHAQERRTATVVVISYLVHLVSDELGNKTKPGTYSLLWRVANGFRLETLSRDPRAGIQGRQEDLDSLNRLTLRIARNLGGARGLLFEHRLRLP